MSKEGYAKEILSIEANAISALLDDFPKDFEKVVSLIAENAGSSHLVTSGVGKASFVAMKCSATFASTGVPSFFLRF
jgi:D-arabinose 5-phosphate isomerase GutQ